MFVSTHTSDVRKLMLIDTLIERLMIMPSEGRVAEAPSTQIHFGMDV